MLERQNEKSKRVEGSFQTTKDQKVFDYFLTFFSVGYVRKISHCEKLRPGNGTTTTARFVIIRATLLNETLGIMLNSHSSWHNLPPLFNLNVRFSHLLNVTLVRSSHFIDQVL